MSMASLYSNENFPLPVVEELKRLGHDVLTIQEAGHANQEQPDEDVLAFASAAGRSVLTINRRDFIRLHRNSASHQGIVACTADLDFLGQARRVHDALRTHGSLAGKLIRVNRPA